MAFKRILDPDFKYRTADRTNIKLTFRRIRRKQKESSPGEPAVLLERRRERGSRTR
jgi:hypothetical protein